MSKKNCIEVPGSICNIRSYRDHYGRRRLEGLRKINEIDDTAPVHAQCKQKCNNSSSCKGFFTYVNTKGESCFHCTTSKKPAKFSRINNLQICDDGQDQEYLSSKNINIPHYDLPNKNNYTTNLIKILNKTSNFYEQRIADIVAQLNVAYAEKEELQMTVSDLTLGKQDLESELSTTRTLLETETERANELTLNLTEIGQDIETCNAHLKVSEDSLIQKQTQYETLQQEFATLKQQHDELKASLSNEVDDDMDLDDFVWGDPDPGTTDPGTTNPGRGGPICGVEGRLDEMLQREDVVRECLHGEQWVCKDNEWVCPNDKYDCSTFPLETDNEYCPGKICTKYGPSCPVTTMPVCDEGYTYYPNEDLCKDKDGFIQSDGGIDPPDENTTSPVFS